MDWNTKSLPRRWLTRAVVLLLVASLLAPSAVSALTYEPTNLQAGSIESPADGTTVISIQGFRFQGQSNGKKPARLVAVGERGDVKWVHNGSKLGVTWFYDVDPLDNGNLLVVGTNKEGTTVYELDPETQERVWVERLDIHDTHDVDLINGDQLLVANMRNYNESTGTNGDRLFVYDRGKDEIVWEWRFDNYYDKSGGGDYTDDWTHVNDVDKIDDGTYLASPRNFDQVIVVNRSTKDIEMQLGTDENHSAMYEQHNPQYLTSDDGTPTVIVADSGNDRIVEYEKTDDGWNRTWKAGSSATFTWPRDADRLANGNTLVTDSINHRVVEINPQGEIVWEFYAPWAPYDAARITNGNEDGGPTIADQNATGSYEVSGGAGLTPGASNQITFAQLMANAFAGTPVADQAKWLANRWSHITPWIRPVWMGPWDFVAAVGAGLLVLAWGLGEVVYQRDRIRSGIGRLLALAGR